VPKSREEAKLRGLGAKYGATVRKRYSRVVGLLKLRRKCPHCGAWKLRRMAAGIWRCSSCDHRIAGGAYEISTHS